MNEKTSGSLTRNQALSLITVNNGKLVLNEEAAQIITSITEPIAIVSIAGLSRTGKSFIMNQLIGNQKGFQIGPSVHPCTKGIWTWGNPIKASNENHQDFKVIFIDTEGQGGFRASETHDSSIFALGLLLSSFFIYNSLGSIDDNAITRLGVVTELSKHIRTKGKIDEANSDLSNFFPSFMWLLRDFSLKLVDQQDNHISSNDYLEIALSTETDHDSENKEQYKAKTAIKNALREQFTDRECFVMVRPVIDEEKLQNLCSVPEEEIRPEFKHQVNALKKHVYSKIKPKELHGNKLNGRMFINLCKSYINALNEGGIVIDTCWDNVVRTECETIFLDTLRMYKNRIHSVVKEKGIVDEKTLDTHHREIEEECMAHFSKLAIGDDLDHHKSQLRRAMFAERCRCMDKLSSLSRELCDKVITKTLKTLSDRTDECSDVTSLEREYDSAITAYNKNAKGSEKNNVLFERATRWLFVAFDLLLARTKNQLQHESDQKVKIMAQKHLSYIKKQEQEIAQKIRTLELNHEEELKHLENKLNNAFSKETNAMKSNYEAEISKLRQSEVSLHQEINVLKESIKSLQKERDQSSHLLNELQDVFKCQQDKLVEAEQFLQNEKMIKDSLLIEKTIASGELERIKSHLDQEVTSNQQLRNELLMESEQKQSTERILHEIRLECDTVKLEISECRNEIVRVEESKLKVQIKLDNLKLDSDNAIQTLNNKIQLLEQSTIPELEQRIRMNEKKHLQQLELIHLERDSLNEKMEQECTRSIQLNEESSKQQHLVQKLERELSSKNAQIRSLERNLSSEREKVQESENKLRSSLREQTTKLLSLDRATELEKRVEHLNETNRKVLALNKALMEELSCLKNDLCLSDSFDSPHVSPNVVRIFGTPTPSPPLMNSSPGMLLPFKRRGSASDVFSSPNVLTTTTTTTTMMAVENAECITPKKKMKSSSSTRPTNFKNPSQSEKVTSKASIKINDGMVYKEMTVTHKRSSLTPHVTEHLPIDKKHAITKEGKENDPTLA
ncbi:guanylate-binding protein [Acrasis kona]|uniref:Guanylate-binding protein n=1 Tax=Acrasis kona TaxID=1008807 RepID=A0AAW2YLN0_9EUKA